MTTADPQSEFTGILLYDGDCPFCSAASTAMRQLDSVGVVPWDDPAAQAFLEAQFDETPFALFFADIEAETVWSGRAAATELCKRAGMPVLVQDIVDGNYEQFADAIQSVVGADRELDPYHDAYPMADDAAALFDRLAAKGDRTHVPNA
ncbi:DCC1-like thiol-disulfide oxidoreductase family protein [Natrinema salifodinae]|uniref:Predicted thiol-disulfide oxidoreductase YuxK, DCC family n=1 Tax=Natrinema salifodinae TaxID=1202768 RepID=A0A1I0M399_9EURY|nr:DCC1-like thiol-disulfide oxidoreductase family protein [Natrinema salifodinae]SEV82907.1 Predicted thiol-disulfide oxidoreductase YuxK, DCC family [Natrinema salifodinae]